MHANTGYNRVLQFTTGHYWLLQVTTCYLKLLQVNLVYYRLLKIITGSYGLVLITTSDSRINCLLQVVLKTFTGVFPSNNTLFLDAIASLGVLK